ncbi:MAG: aminopeptidase [Saprospiraceae bacterium]|nr:aminopeptidase [Saprospiraceae bacterium]HMW40027.1 aminopeptidase [Saprospiraceae bacterium]HMX89023.1 aminopeptidase [Saprospiraceae bacterium]HMZ40081.1 aminopeptidase [Saprospiraceae bacterium]HNB30048.1 aminopeptidase [Saprospiraceae bacterium]
MTDFDKRYAKLLGEYSLYLKPGELVYLRTTVLAHDLVREFSKVCIDRGARLVTDIEYEDQENYLVQNGSDDLLQFVPSHRLELMRTCDAYLVIRAPFEVVPVTSDRAEAERIRQQALAPIQEIYFERLGNGSLKRSLCQYPTAEAARLAAMSITEYQNFVAHACAIDQEEPMDSWKALSRRQSVWIDYLSKVKRMEYRHTDWSISFAVEGRTWINSDGKSNMPSGEVFTSPIEDSVEGSIYFNYPTGIFGGRVGGIRLEVVKGEIIAWTAEEGQSFLDRAMTTEGGRRFGEVAIGTNDNIQRATRNILFDEKIGGTIHMAVGQSYYQCGGKNKSAIHWDLITEMKNGGSIFADGELIYRDGKFLI